MDHLWYDCPDPKCNGFARKHLSANHLFVCDCCHTVYIRKDNKLFVFEKKLNFDSK